MTPEVIEPEAAALHLARAYELSTLSWAACVQTGKMDLIEQAQAALDAVKQAQRHLPETATKRRQTGNDSEGFSLSDLSALESVKPDLETLRGLLGQALTVAERIDEARGRSYPEPVGGSCGWDFAEEVNQLLARVELDSGGARGKGLE
jgi:hypothetical protein